MDHEQQTKIKSSISGSLIQLTLKKGGGVAACGATLIILSGCFMPLYLLKIWGIPLFFLGVFLIGFGLLPYRKLTRLQLKPHELYDCSDFFLFFKSGKPLFKIPKASVACVKYVEKDHLYGVGIWLKKPSVEKVKVLQRRFNLESFSSDSLYRFECDLFLPYFKEQEVKTLFSKYLT